MQLKVLRCFQWIRSISLVVGERGRLARRVWRPAKHIFIRLTFAPIMLTVTRSWRMLLVGRSCRFALTKTAPPYRVAHIVVTWRIGAAINRRESAAPDESHRERDG